LDTVGAKFDGRHDPESGAPGREPAGCRVDDVLKLLAREWMSHIVWSLARAEGMRFGALRRALPGRISARVLSHRLKELEAHGLATRHDAGTLPPHVEYRLTPEGRRLDAALRLSEDMTSGLDGSGQPAPPVSTHRRNGR
jgi:DNA-binding HxlR family transcriptional regulator